MLLYTIATWLVGLCILNQFAMLYVLGLLYVVTVTGAAFHVGMRRLAPFVTYMGYRTDGKKLLAVEVEDTGRGMEPEFLDRAFLPFAQASAGTTRTHEGTGLGLTLVHRLTEAMDGKMDVETVPRVGSRFTIWLGRISHMAAVADAGSIGSNGGRSDRAFPAHADASIGLM